MAGSSPSNAAFGTINPYEGSDISQLTLANGMTAGYGDNDGNTSNPPLVTPSDYANSINPYGGNPNWPIKRVGLMRNTVVLGSVGGSAPTGPGTPYYLYFLYNPNDIQVSFTLNPTNLPPSYLYNGNSDPSLNVPNLVQNQIVSWTLLFDRTYDMLYDPKPGQNRGVLKDTAALYNILGSFSTESAQPYSSPVQVVFGQTDSGQLWGFTGYVTMVNIDYGIFRHDMIPSRCEVQLNMTAQYVGQSVPAPNPTAPTSSGLLDQSTGQYGYTGPTP